VCRSKASTAFVRFETDYMESLITLSRDSVSDRSGVSAMENGENWGDLRGLEDGGLMLRPDGSFVSGDPTDYLNWARILLDLERVEKRRVGFVPKRIGKHGLYGWNGYPYPRSSTIPTCVRVIE
jgi:hypothetical protein